MISDVLCEACEEMNRYLREMPETYAYILPEVLHVMRAMDELRQKLDTPTPPPVYAGRP